MSILAWKVGEKLEDLKKGDGHEGRGCVGGLRSGGWVGWWRQGELVLVEGYFGDGISSWSVSCWVHVCRSV